MGKLMVGVVRILPLCAVVLVLPAVAAAFPIAAPGTEGFELIVQSTEPVVATYQGNSATFSNDLYLMLDGSGNPGDDGNPANDKFIFNNHTSPVGSMVPLGSFPVGTTLIFRLHVNDTNTDYYTGPGNRNPDGQPHARAQANWLPNETLVSFEDLLNGPFNYNDLSFSFANTVGACNPTLREPCGYNTQRVYPTERPQGLAPNLIVIVHGCCTDESGLNEWEGFRSSIKTSIEQHQLPGAWEIVVWDWTDVTKSKIPGIPGSPGDAYRGAPEHGKKLGKEIVNPPAKPGWQYNYVHFIAHSAGSRLIHEAAKYITTEDDRPPFIHSTFLDAYTPNGDQNSYACHSNYAEHYVDRGLPLTRADLWGAYNFDITDLPKAPLTIPSTPFLSGYGWPNDLHLQYHFWPVDWYQQSIDNSGIHSFGFPLSFEYNGNEEDPSNFYDRLKQDLQSQWSISAGDVCVLTLNGFNTECRKDKFASICQSALHTRLVGSSIPGGAPAVKTSPIGTVDLSLDEVAGVSATMSTDSPVWFEAPITTTTTFSLLKFDYEFLSTAESEGIVTVFVDDQLVYTIDERITDPGANTALDIPIGELTPGTHTIGVRLDPFTDVQSVVRISNIEFGEVGNTSPPGTANLQPTRITFDSSTAVVGGTVFFDSGVSNTGDVDTGIFNIKWLVNGQEVGAAGSHAGVPAGQTVLNGNSQFSWRFDRSGRYSVTFIVDFANQVAESNEGDNSTTTDVVVTQSPPPPPGPPGPPPPPPPPPGPP
jgi:hypothetical protein